MRIIGFNFTKVSIEKFKDAAKDLKINSNIDISSIEPLKTDILKTKEELLGVSFSYEVDYAPNYAQVEIKGNIIVAFESKLAKNILKEWKSKKLLEEIRIPLYNLILRKSSIKALPLESDLNLPLHLPLPTFRKEDQNN